MIAPVFVLDSREAWRPVGVDESMAAVKPRLRGGSLDGAVCDSPTRLTNAARLDWPANMRQPELELVGYHRVVRAGPLFWSQYWLWWLYNPGPPILRGEGAHEGDWEVCQIGFSDAGMSLPVLVTGSQHHTGGKREHWACELAGRNPVVYVALGSHAVFFTPGRHGTDECDGKGPVLDAIAWRPFGKWSTWPGRWGNSTGTGKSPESPGCQGQRWNHPHLYHARASGQ